jgi:hypothetical protein
VTETAVATEVHEALDIHGDFGPQFTFNLMLVIDHPADIVDLTIGEVVRFSARIDIEFLKNTRRCRPTNAVNVCQTDIDALTSG